MLGINKHIDTIVHRNTGGTLDTRVQGHLDFVTLERDIEGTQEHPTIHRIVSITAENQQRHFTVQFEEMTLGDPSFKFQIKEKTFDLLFGEHMIEQAARYVFDLLHGPVKPKLIPPPAYIAKWQEINDRWLLNTSFCVHLFLQDSEFGDDWRFKIVHANGTVICETLDPATADGHTYLMLARSAEEAFKRGVQEGEVATIERLCHSIAERGVSANEHGLWRYPIEVRRLIGSHTFRIQKPAVI